MNLFILIKRILHKRYIRKISRYFMKGNYTILLPNFNIRLDNPIVDKKYLEIGKDCIINGNFVFESTEGKITIGDHCFIGPSTFISRSAITIGNNVTIAWGCTIYDHNSHSLNFKDRRQDIEDQLSDIKNGVSFIKNKNWETVNAKPIIIEDDAWIGFNCIILKGITIGEGAIVGAGSVVTRDIPPWTVVGGNPARVIKQLERGY